MRSLALLPTLSPANAQWNGRPIWWITRPSTGKGRSLLHVGVSRGKVDKDFYREIAPYDVVFGFSFGIFLVRTTWQDGELAGVIKVLDVIHIRYPLVENAAEAGWSPSGAHPWQQM